MINNANNVFVVIMMKDTGIDRCNLINFSISSQVFSERRNSILGAFKNFCVLLILGGWCFKNLINSVFRIYIVNQTDQNPFNRGMLLNAGFRWEYSCSSFIVWSHSGKLRGLRSDPSLMVLWREAQMDFPWNCLIFHDVDLLPLNETNTYRCSKVK